MKIINLKYRYFFTLLSLFSFNFVFAQEIEIELGKKTISLNEPYTITVTVKNDNIKNYKGFPEIPGLSKRGVSSSTSTNIINNKVSTVQNIIQNYVAQREGTYRIKPFNMEVNGEIKSVEGGTVTVTAARQSTNSNANDPFGNDLFEEFFGNKEKKEFVEVRENAFFALTTDKKSVYVGEGFTAALAFYVADDNRAEMNFHQVGSQLIDILKKIKPANCWEENFGLDEIQPLPVSINGKEYTEYKIYQAAFYPLNNKPIVFPSVGFKMIKYKVAKEPGFFGLDRRQDFKVFNSQTVTVTTKELPPHPLRDKVAVGNFRLAEEIEKRDPSTGESVGYNFRIAGEGNISAIDMPDMPRDGHFDFYPPNIRQDISRSNGRVTGTKNFSYQIIPKEPGEYPLKDYFEWIFFNPVRARYDTLVSKIVMDVKGESLKNQGISSTDLGTFYNSINNQDNTLISSRRSDWMRTGTNILILLMLIATAGLILKK
ncbi:MAG: BatD family protein [Bacteroidota bacterium]